MRLIKFRAWHKKWNFMFNINQIDWDKKLIWSEDMPVFSTHSGWEIKDGLSCIDHEKKTVRLGWCPFDLVESLDQFTGLFDKNGKEIYEGDIVTWGWEKVEVKFGTLLEDEDEGKNRTGWLCQDCFIDSECEIVGNIYENTELLKNS